jgi:hypothetical protein
MDHVILNGIWPAVGLLGVNVPDSIALAQRLQFAHDMGVAFVVPSGDESKDACNYMTSSPYALTAATSTRDDDASIYSNHGGCVDVYAPGLYVKSTWHTTLTANNTISHSPIAAAHVAGAMALVRSKGAFCTPQEVYAKVLSYSVDGVLNNVPANTPNKLLNVPTGTDGYGSCALPLIQDRNFYHDQSDFVNHTDAAAMTDFIAELTPDQWLTEDSAAGVTLKEYQGFKLDPATGKIEASYGDLAFFFDQPTNQFGFTTENSGFTDGLWPQVTLTLSDGSQVEFLLNEDGYHGFDSTTTISSIRIWAMKSGAKISDLHR